MTTQDTIGRTSANLRAILNLIDDLSEQAIHNSQRDIPGGNAMVELGPIANLEAWEHQHATDERTGSHYTQADVEDPEEGWPASQRIKWWAEAWRRELGAEYDDQHTTLATEVKFLRFHLEWGSAQSTWTAFSDDVYSARRRLEDIVSEGSRDIVSNDVACLICNTPLRRRMTRELGYEDEWWCIECHHHLTSPQFNLAASEAARRAFSLDA